MPRAVKFVKWILEGYGPTLARMSRRVTAVAGPWARWWGWSVHANTLGHGALMTSGGREDTLQKTIQAWKCGNGRVRHVYILDNFPPGML